MSDLGGWPDTLPLSDPGRRPVVVPTTGVEPPGYEARCGDCEAYHRSIIASDVREWADGHRCPYVLRRLGTPAAVSIRRRALTDVALRLHGVTAAEDGRTAHMYHWLAMLTEQLGGVSADMQPWAGGPSLRAELVELAATALAAVEALEAGRVEGMAHQVQPSTAMRAAEAEAAIKQ